MCAESLLKVMKSRRPSTPTKLRIYKAVIRSSVFFCKRQMGHKKCIYESKIEGVKTQNAPKNFVEKKYKQD